MHLAVAAEPGKSGIREARLASGGWLRDGERCGAATDLAVGKVGEGRAPGPRGGFREATRDDRRVEIDDVDERAADVRRDGADPHPGECLAQTGFERGDESGDGLVRAHGLRSARARELGRELDGEARLDRGGSDREDHGHRVDVEDVDSAHGDIGPAAEAGSSQGGVHGTDREDRRDGQPVDRPGGVGDEDDRGAAAGGDDGVRAEALQRGLEASRTLARIPRRVERPNGLAVSTDRGDQPVHVDDDGPCQANGPWPARRPAEQRRPSAELHPQVHDHPLALRVDRRVGDLGEGLAEMVGQRPVQPRAAGRWRVVAHAPQRLVRLKRHRLDVEAGALRVETGEIAHHVVGGVVPAARRATVSVLVHGPRSIVDREGAECACLRLGVLEDRPAAGLDEEELARTQPATPDGLGRGERDGARLGRDGHEPVSGDGKGCGPQPVPVDKSADRAAIGEHDRRRPVPRRQEPGRAASQGGDMRMRCASEREGLGDRGQQRRGQVPAGRHQELEALVERE